MREWKIRIWDYDQWLNRVLSGETKEEALDCFLQQHSWLKSRREEIFHSMIDFD